MNIKTRRNFIKSSAALASLSILPTSIWASSKNGRLRTAHVGIGGMGAADLNDISSHKLVDVVALCDVDSNALKSASKLHPKAKLFSDYRLMFKEMSDSIDAVIVSAPDHTHAPASIMAMEMNKSVYCQKPLTHHVSEARAMRKLAEEKNLVTQMGIQVHSFYDYKLATLLIQSGIIGKVSSVRAWSPKNWGYDGSMPKEEDSIPENLDWDLWLGPAKHRNYHPDYHPLTWRAWIDFGTGSMGDMGCHILDPAFYALELGAPIEIQATSTHYIPEIESQTYPSASIVRMKFPKRGNHPELDLTWSDGRIQPPIPNEFKSGEKFTLSGAMLVGDNGKITHDSHGASGVKIIPEEKMLEYNQPKPYIPRVKTSHEQDWIRACKDGIPASSSFEYGGPLTEMALLGMIAIRCKNEKLLWDSKNLKFKNNEKANSLLHKEYRKGWSLLS